jgi:hypothetical protein
MFLIIYRPFINKQAFNITTILVNRFFIHLIIPENLFVNIFVRLIIDVINYKQDLFIYITIERYISKEFYSVIIDISAFKKSIINYKQYLIYKTIINNNININTI